MDIFRFVYFQFN